MTIVKTDTHGVCRNWPITMTLEILMDFALGLNFGHKIEGNIWLY